MVASLRAVLLVLFASTYVAAAADVVTDWNEKAISLSMQAKLLAPAVGRNVAIVDAAMFDALNSIDRRYQPYRQQLATTPGTSREAAAAAAAHVAVLRLLPDFAKDVEAFYQSTIAAIPEGEAKANGIKLGEKIAADLLAARAGDGADAAITYRPYTTAGAYVPTLFPVFTEWGRVTPFLLQKGSQFRPGPPPALNSERWAADYNEVKAKGAKTGSSRTPEQTDIARMWEATGPVLHNPVVRQLAAGRSFDLTDTARLYALYAMAMTDSYIAVFDAKYAYGFWRPVTAIRNGDIDGSDATARDPLWEPFIATPMHPEYPCAHCINSATAAAVLESVFGDSVPTFQVTSSTGPGVVRKFSRLSDYVRETIEARIYDGVHYRNSGEVGAAMGRQIGEYAVKNFLKPMPKT